MVLPEDLLATPSTSSHAPSATLSDVVSTPVSLQGTPATTGGRNDDPPETPSPCARKVARRVQNNRQEKGSPNDRLIREMRRKSKSPIFVAALAKGLGGEAFLANEEPANKSDEGVHITVEAIESDDEDMNEQDGREARPIIIDTDSDCEVDDKDEDNDDNGHDRDNHNGHNGYETPLPSPEDPEKPDSAPLPPFTPQTRTIHAIVSDIREAMTKSYQKSTGQGYILSDRNNQSPFFKIGKSGDVKNREQKQRRKCKLPTWNFTTKPARAIRTPMRLERLAQAELQNFSYVPSCSCGVAHREYFWGEKEFGVDALTFWAGWLRGKDEDSDPFDSNDQLKPFWVDRLDHFQDRINDYFRCDAPRCAEKDEEAPACQACLRAGWKKFASPTAADELDYACRTKIPSKGLRQIFRSTNSITVVNLVGQTVTTWSLIFDPRVCLYVVSLRLLGDFFVNIALAFVCVSVFMHLQQEYSGSSNFAVASTNGGPSSNADPSPRSRKAAGRKRGRGSLSAAETVPMAVGVQRGDVSIAEDIDVPDGFQQLGASGDQDEGRST
ncbi:hypothetical protein BDW74DRAFT_158781, partial [Aspergillus multicolor]|uniref:GIY-YIG nuclease family protein n=1 Tax=Aspergillus multicolor TaxID=41759 RepID=UPI003CCD7D80